MKNEFNDIITQLHSLQSIHANKAFQNKVKNVFIPSLPNTERPSPLFALPIIRAALVLVIFLIVTGSGMILASVNSQPGDLLYPVIHVFKHVQSTLSTDPGQNAIIHLQNADNTIKSINQAIKKRDIQQIQQSTSQYEHEVQQAKNASQEVSQNDQNLQNTINQNLENNAKQLENVQQIVPTTAQPAIEHAIQISSQNPAKTGSNDTNQAQDKNKNSSQDNQNSNSNNHQLLEQKQEK